MAGKEEEKNTLLPSGPTKALLNKIKPEDKIKVLDYADTFPEVQKLLSSYPEELHDSLVITGAQLLYLVRYQQDTSFGMERTVPLNCQGGDCDFADVCAYYKIGIAPVGYSCPEEVEVVRAVVPQLIRDLGVDIESYLEINMIQEYVDALIQEHRAQKYLALENDMVPRAIGIDQATGAPIWQEDTAPALSNKERAQRKKEKLRKEFVATREMRLKFKVGSPEDESQKAAEIREQVEEAKKRAQEAEYEDIEERDTGNLP